MGTNSACPFGCSSLNTFTNTESTSFVKMQTRRSRLAPVQRKRVLKKRRCHRTLKSHTSLEGNANSLSKCLCAAKTLAQPHASAKHAIGVNRKCSYYMRNTINWERNSWSLESVYKAWRICCCERFMFCLMAVRIVFLRVWDMHLLVLLCCV